jgi:hypothetical protein
MKKVKWGEYKSLKGNVLPFVMTLLGTHSLATFHQLKVWKCMMSFSFTSKPISYHVARVKTAIVLLKVIGAKNGNNILQQQKKIGN